MLHDVVELAVPSVRSGVFAPCPAVEAFGEVGYVQWVIAAEYQSGDGKGDAFELLKLLDGFLVVTIRAVDGKGGVRDLAYSRYAQGG